MARGEFRGAGSGRDFVGEETQWGWHGLSRQFALEQQLLFFFLLRKISPRLIFSILMQDEGNTNYSVMLPRDQFERRVNARLVADAVQEMGIHAVNVTDRYDVCVGDRKVHTYIP